MNREPTQRDLIILGVLSLVIGGLFLFPGIYMLIGVVKKAGTPSLPLAFILLFCISVGLIGCTIAIRTLTGARHQLAFKKTQKISTVVLGISGVFFFCGGVLGLWLLIAGEAKISRSSLAGVVGGLGLSLLAFREIIKRRQMNKKEKP